MSPLIFPRYTDNEVELKFSPFNWYDDDDDDDDSSILLIVGYHMQDSVICACLANIHNNSMRKIPTVHSCYTRDKKG